MHQFEWLSERGSNFLHFFRKRGYPERGGFPQKRGGFNPGRNYDFIVNFDIFTLSSNVSTVDFEQVNIGRKESKSSGLNI